MRRRTASVFAVAYAILCGAVVFAWQQSDRHHEAVELTTIDAIWYWRPTWVADAASKSGWFAVRVEPAAVRTVLRQRSHLGRTNAGSQIWFDNGGTDTYDGQ